VRFTLVRSGGFAGVSPPPLSVSTEALPPDEAARLRALVDAAGFFDLPADLGPADAAPDSFGYELTVEDDGAGRRHAVAFGATAAPPALRELMTAVRAAARRSADGGAHGG